MGCSSYVERDEFCVHLSIYGFASVYDSWVETKISDAPRSRWEDLGCNGSVSWHVCSCSNCLCACVVGVHLSIYGRSRVGYIAN